MERGNNTEWFYILENISLFVCFCPLLEIADIRFYKYKEKRENQVDISKSWQYILAFDVLRLLLTVIMIVNRDDDHSSFCNGHV